MMRNCSAWIEWWRGNPGNSTFTPMKIRPSEAKPTAATEKPEIGRRASFLEDFAMNGRRLRTDLKPCCLAIVSASDALITNLRWWSIFLGFWVWCSFDKKKVGDVFVQRGRVLREIEWLCFRGN